MDVYIRSKYSVRLIFLLIIFGIINDMSSTLLADEIHAHPGSIVFSAVQGHSMNETRSIFIFSASGATINWTQSKDVSWLTTNLSSGVTEGILKIGVNTAGLYSGIFYGNITIQSGQSSTGPVIVPVTLIVNPDVPVKMTTWKDGNNAAMSVSVDSRSTGFDALQTNGFSGTYFFRGSVPDSYYTDYYNAGMEIGSHTSNHPCYGETDNDFRTQELEPNISAICTYTPEPCKDVISFAWPCGYTNYNEQAVASDYFLSARGYNINELEDATPDNFMNLKSYNSHEHTPYPPSDLRTVIDDAVSQKKWFNLVLHEAYDSYGSDINYAHSKSIWVESIGTVIKYILQRDRFILTDFTESLDRIACNVSRLQIPSSGVKNFEEAFNSNDLSTVQVDIDDSKTVQNVKINGAISPYLITDLDGNKVLLLNVKLESATTKSVEINYLNNSINLSVSGVTAKNKVYDGTTTATLNTGGAYLTGVVSGDDVTLLTNGATGTFNNKNVGTGKSVSISGFTLGGTDAYKYKLTQPSTTADITRKGLTISGITANNKVYDGTTAATLNTGSATLLGVIGGDAVSLISTGVAATFSDKNTGTGKPVAVSGFSLSGKDEASYIITQPSLAANISAKALLIIANDLTKLYGANLTFKVSDYNIIGLVPGDVAPIIKVSSPGALAPADAGTYIISVGGGSDNNYNFTYVNGKLKVKKSTLKAKADDKIKYYGSGNPSFTITYTGFVNNEDVSVLDVTPVAATIATAMSEAGSYTITVSGGSDNNYDLVLVNGTLKILKATLTITADDKTIAYSESIPDLTINYSGFVLGQDQSVLDVLPVAKTDASSNSDAGIYDINVFGAADSSYDFIYKKGTLDIKKVNQEISFEKMPLRLRMTQKYSLNARATSGLEVSFKLSDPEIGSLSNNILTIKKEGNVIISATQDGDQNWNPAPEVTQSIITLPTFDGISSLFTPNNDGMNDYWYITDLGQYGKLQVTVYNRFGQIVYQSDGYKNDWDGTWNGNPLPSASYYYIIRSSAKGIIKGVVNIIR